MDRQIVIFIAAILVDITCAASKIHDTTFLEKRDGLKKHRGPDPVTDTDGSSRELASVMMDGDDDLLDAYHKVKLGSTTNDDRLIDRLAKLQERTPSVPSARPLDVLDRLRFKRRTESVDIGERNDPLIGNTKSERIGDVLSEHMSVKHRHQAPPKASVTPVGMSTRSHPKQSRESAVPDGNSAQLFGRGNGDSFGKTPSADNLNRLQRGALAGALIKAVNAPVVVSSKQGSATTDLSGKRGHLPESNTKKSIGKMSSEDELMKPQDKRPGARSKAVGDAARKLSKKSNDTRELPRNIVPLHLEHDEHGIFGNMSSVNELIKLGKALATDLVQPVGDTATSHSKQKIKTAGPGETIRHLSEQTAHISSESGKTARRYGPAKLQRVPLADASTKTVHIPASDAAVGASVSRSQTAEYDTLQHRLGAATPSKPNASGKAADSPARGRFKQSHSDKDVNRNSTQVSTQATDIPAGHSSQSPVAADLESSSGQNVGELGAALSDDELGAALNDDELRRKLGGALRDEHIRLQHGTREATSARKLQAPGTTAGTPARGQASDLNRSSGHLAKRDEGKVDNRTSADWTTKPQDDSTLSQVPGKSVGNMASERPKQSNATPELDESIEQLADNEEDESLGSILSEDESLKLRNITVPETPIQPESIAASGFPPKGSSTTILDSRSDKKEKLGNMTSTGELTTLLHGSLPEVPVKHINAPKKSSAITSLDENSGNLSENGNEEKLGSMTGSDSIANSQNEEVTVAPARGIPAEARSSLRNIAANESVSSGRLNENNHGNLLDELINGDDVKLAKASGNTAANGSSNITKDNPSIPVQATLHHVNRTDPVNETGQYACLVQAKNKSWLMGGSPTTWDMGKWQCMNIPATSDDKISSFHAITGSSCSVQFYGGSDCQNQKPLFETKHASLNKFRYTSGTNLRNSGYDDKISSVRCSCVAESVFMYKGFIRIPGSDCEGHLPGTNFFTSTRINQSSTEAATTCRNNCEKLGNRCLGFKMWRLGGDNSPYTCSYADGFWFKSHTDLTAETYFAVDSEQSNAPDCFIRTFGPR